MFRFRLDLLRFVLHCMFQYSASRRGKIKLQDSVAVAGDIWGQRSLGQASMARQQLVEVDNELSLPHVQKHQTQIINFT